ncbi:LacI family DNA-binding transcriptional regulator [Alkalicoccobacillus porphyridii]|uniref:LacI family transcriptional regulator n=1 Tax=Alkalicoccobacillus porphyridii TaxID=2597270 RepID=A0A553ZVU6_9BACI|nr:LacI family DNA-binding transcriptional regulator [Alkalicoccobacillus porphyridii]TSB45601.1 LacI family transcriptional regulator [Alkalicoccobacillus porphyridii]
MVSIRDIAKKAGVSMTSVSYALNGNPKVSKKTTEHIKRIAEELNYRPNAAARTLKTRYTKKIGIFIKESSGIFFGDILSGVIDMCSSAGYDTVVCTGKNATNALIDASVDGGLIMDNNITSEEIMRLADIGRKIVVLDRMFYHKHVRQVLLDNEKGAKDMASHLIKRPSARTYIVTGSKENFDSQERVKSALQAYAELAPSHQVEVIEGLFDLDGGLDAARKIEEAFSGEPVNVFSLSDSTAVGMQKYWQEKGLRIGKDIRLAGFDNSLLSQYITPPLTTIDYSTNEWGKEAARVLLQLISEEEAHHVMIPTSLKARASTTE